MCVQHGLLARVGGRVTGAAEHIKTHPIGHLDKLFVGIKDEGM